MTEFYIGQKVVCVDAGERPGSPDAPRLLSNGAIYTVAEVLPYRWRATISGIGLRLNGIIRKPENAPWGEDRFRPLEFRAMQVFRKIAANPKIEIREDA